MPDMATSTVDAVTDDCHVWKWVGCLDIFPFPGGLSFYVGIPDPKLETDGEEDDLICWAMERLFPKVVEHLTQTHTQLVVLRPGTRIWLRLPRPNGGDALPVMYEAGGTEYWGTVH